MKITVMGTGAYSLGLANILAKKDKNTIMLWTEKKENVLEFNKKHQLNSIFPNVTFKENITITDSYEEALANTNLIFLVTSAKYIYEVCKNMQKYYHNTPICIASKGIDDKTLNPLSNVVKNTLNTKNVAVISGPTFAIDLINIAVLLYFLFA